MAKQFKTKNKQKRAQLDAMAQSQERVLMPRPTVFRDKTKYDRKRDKQNWKQACYA